MTITSLNSLTQLPTPALGFLPAIHDSVAEATPLDGSGRPALPTALEAKGRVYVNQTSAPVNLPAYGGWPVRNVAPGEYYGSDGRLFYRVVRKPGTSSHYPTSFERTIYTFPFTAQSFAIGDKFELSRLFYFRLIGNNTPAVWSVIFEVGAREDEPDPAGPNIGRIVWREPLLDQQVLITDVKSKNGLGIVLYRRAETSLRTNGLGYEADAMIYNKAVAVPPDRLPESTEFLLRVRIGQFDIVDDVAEPRGHVAYVIRPGNSPEDQDDGS